MTTDSPSTATRQQKKTRLTIVLLFAIFLAPLVGSWILYKFTDLGRDGGAASHGDLILPPKTLEDVALRDPFDEEKETQLHKKWSLFYFSKKGCDDQCLKNVYSMRQIRLAVGKHFERVQRVILVDVITDEEALKKSLENFKGQLILDSEKVDQAFIDAFKVEGVEDPYTAGRFYIIDPLGNLMMSYAPDHNPKGVIQDLTKIFRVSRI